MRATAATERYHTSLGPGSLVLCQELANSAAAGPAVDLLSTVDIARPWLRPLLRYWCHRHAQPDPALILTPARLRALRAVRAGLRDLLGGAEGVRLDAPVRVSAGSGPATVRPAGPGTAWVRSALAVELLTAGEQRYRLKLCRNPACAVAFYDRSNNNSRRWHAGNCGNLASVRAYRARRRSAG